jgi:hypothetical protein
MCRRLTGEMRRKPRRRKLRKTGRRGGFKGGPDSRTPVRSFVVVSGAAKVWSLGQGMISRRKHGRCLEGSGQFRVAVSRGYVDAKRSAELSNIDTGIKASLSHGRRQVIRPAKRRPVAMADIRATRHLAKSELRQHGLEFRQLIYLREPCRSQAITYV